jgi:hypothetical protein
VTWETDLLDNAPDREVAMHVATAIERLLREDDYLLKVDANERSISHWLALYLADEFCEWDVDCEFNRDWHDPKRLQLEPDHLYSDDDQGTTVYPDIIVHRRGEPKNLLAIEIKKDSGGNGDKDLRKLRALRGQLGYTHGLFLRFGTGHHAGVTELHWSSE